MQAEGKCVQLLGSESIRIPLTVFPHSQKQLISWTIHIRNSREFPALEITPDLSFSFAACLTQYAISWNIALRPYSAAFVRKCVSETCKLSQQTKTDFSIHTVKTIKRIGEEGELKDGGGRRQRSADQQDRVEKSRSYKRSYKVEVLIIFAT